ncbi:MAG: transcriptional regulator [Lachnospiraceae bacterium]|nr:transcriptional regulator [Lachnospiraceae bacterium]
MKPIYNVKDVMKVLGVGETYAYKIIRQLNDELNKKGYLTVRGKVNAKYFNERFMIEGTEVV